MTPFAEALRKIFCKGKIPMYGSAGRLEIPALKIGVPLYLGNSENAQDIVDQEDSAVFLHWKNQDAIADHSSQANFRNLNGVAVGFTVAYICQADGTKEEYTCYQSQIGQIRDEGDRNRLYDATGESVAEKNNGGLCIYTCRAMPKNGVTEVRITYWRKRSNEQK